jgi:NAD(P)-dependent dehydrogenase (short-subunit alcohol dehydrogenase family)
MPKSPNKKANKVVQGKIALVAGATRGAGRGIAIALGEAGATVYCTGRSSQRNTKARPAVKPGVSETIEETAELVTAAGGLGIAVRVDHTVPAEVKKLVAQIKRRHKHLDILVNDIWGGDALTEFGKPFWKVNLENGLQMLKQAVHSHIITAHYAAPLILGQPGGIIFEITDGDAFYYRGNIFYDLVKISVIRLAFAMSRELRKRNIASVALTPGFLRSERVLAHFGVTEANWKEAGKRKNANVNWKDQNDAPQDFMVSESPRYIGRAVAALAADPHVMKKTGRVFSSWGWPANTGSPTSMALNQIGAPMPERNMASIKSATKNFIPTGHRGLSTSSSLIGFDSRQSTNLSRVRPPTPRFSSRSQDCCVTRGIAEAAPSDWHL